MANFHTLVWIIRNLGIKEKCLIEYISPANLRSCMALEIISLFCLETGLNVEVKEPAEQAVASVIWMHGLGADASDMKGLVEYLTLDNIPLRHVFMNAPIQPVTLNGGMVMPSWYDILGTELIDRQDKEGIEQSAMLIQKVIDAQLEDGFKPEHIFLAGFSQGGAMAIYTALRNTRLGGVVALSAYVPLTEFLKPELAKNTPFFMAAGQFDPLVLPLWGQQSKKWLMEQGYQNIDFHVYPMDHSICFEEIKELSFWFVKQVRGVS